MGDRNGVIVDGEVVGLQWRKGKDLKEVWRDSKMSLGRGYQQGVRVF